jgi:hypothetical protein
MNQSLQFIIPRSSFIVSFVVWRFRRICSKIPSVKKAPEKSEPPTGLLCEEKVKDCAAGACILFGG